MIDADDFKAYNDLYGHPAGDRCLRALSNVFLATCRPGDMVGRYGGEEFAILLPNTSARAAHAVATRLLTAVRDLRLKHAKRPNGFVTVSLGVASLTPETDQMTSVELLEAADRALYRAKKEGRDQVCQAEDVHKRGQCSRPASDGAQSNKSFCAAFFKKRLPSLPKKPASGSPRPFVRNGADAGDRITLARSSRLLRRLRRRALFGVPRQRSGE